MKFKTIDIVRAAQIFLCACLVLAGGTAFAGDRFQTVSIDPIPGQVYGNNPIELIGSAQSGLPLGYLSETPGICHISGPDSNGRIYVAIDTGGICQVIAEQQGDATWAYAFARRSFFIDKATQTMSASVNGSQVLFGGTATVFGGSNVVGMPVTLSSSTPATCSLSGNTVTGLAAGSCSILFVQPGDARFYPASTVLTFAVIPIAQATLSMSFSYGLTMPFGLTQTVSVNGGSGTGAVTLYSTNANCTISGLALTGAGAGSCEVYATKAADNNYLERSTGNQPIVITKVDQPAAAIVLSGATEFGAVLNMSYTGGGGTGTVSYSSNNPICAVNGNVLTLTSLGFCTISGLKQGDANYNLGGVNTAFNVVKARQVITVTPFGAKVVGDAPFVLQAQTNYSFPVRAIFNFTPGVCAMGGAANLTVTPLAVGTCSINLTADGDANHDNVVFAYNFDIGNGSQSIVFGTPPVLGFGGTATLVASASSGLPITFTSTTPGVCTVSGNVVSAVAQGNCSVTASQPGNANYSAATPQTLTIAIGKGSQAIQFGPAPSLTVGGSAVISATGGGSGNAVVFASATPAVCILSGATLTVVASGVCTVTADQAGNADYFAAPRASLSISIFSASWTATTPLNTARWGHTLTTLADGRILAVGGITFGSVNVASAELFDPAAGTWTSITGPAAPRHGHSATLLADGRVLIAGGGEYNTYTETLGAEILNPVTSTWSAGGNIGAGRLFHTATRMSDGRVLIAGGQEIYQSDLDTAARYDPATNTWSATGPMTAARSGHTANLLVSGIVLVVGGQQFGSDKTELYNPAGNNWLVGPRPNSARFHHSAATLPDGSVLVAGGSDPSTGMTLDSGERYIPVNNAWVPAAALPGVRSRHGAMALADGSVLLMGGVDENGSPRADSYVYIPAAGVWRSAGDAVSPHDKPVLALLADGRVLEAGNGYGVDYPSVDAQLFDPGNLPPGAPTSVNATAGIANATVTFTGNAFATSYGATSAPGGATGSCTAPCASIVVSGLANGTAYTFTVRANNGFGTSAASAASNSVTPQALQVIAFGLAPSISVGSTGVVSAAGGASGNAVVFSSTTPSVCTVSGLNGSVVTGIAAGACTIAANQTGNANYNAAPQVTQTFSIELAGQNITFGSAPTINVGGTGFISAAGGASGNPLTFASTTTNVCTVLGAAVTGIAGGACTIAVNQAGNANYNAAPQATQTFSIGLAGQSITFGAAPAIIVGGSGTVSATGGASGNPVTFSSTTVSVCTTSGATIAGVTAGTCIIAANQAGNASYNAAPQATQSFNIDPANQTITFGTIPTITVGGSGTVAAIGGASGNPVIFSSTTAAVCTVSGATVSGITAGTCVIAANQTGNTSYNAAPQVTQSFNIGAANQIITFGTAPTIVVGGTGTLSATGGASGNAVTFTSTTPTVCTVAGNVVSGVTVGTCTIAANQAGNASFTAAPQVTQGFAIGVAMFTVTPSAGANGTINPSVAQTVTSGALIIFTVTPNSGYSASVSGTCGGSLAGTTFTTAAITGNCTVVASFSLTNTVPGAPTIGSGTAGNGQATITFTAPASDGGSPILSYTATSAPAGLTGTCAAPCTSINVTGLTNGTAYTFTVKATNSVGSGAASGASNSVTPVALFTVTPTAGANGTINPAIAQSVTSGATTTFTVIPNGGYIASVNGSCGGSLIGTTYTTNAITADCSVIASFPSGATSTTTLTSSANPTNHGQSVTLTATVSGGVGTPTGSVAFRDGENVIPGCEAVTLSGGVAQCVNSRIPAGSRILTAQYAGNATYGSSTSAPLGQTVIPGVMPLAVILYFLGDD